MNIFACSFIVFSQKDVYHTCGTCNNNGRSHSFPVFLFFRGNNGVDEPD